MSLNNAIQINFTDADLFEIKEVELNADRYAGSPDRPNPFDSEMLKDMIFGQSFSTLTRTKIDSLDKALDHARAVCHSWYLEDRDARIKARLEANRRRQSTFRENQKKRIFSPDTALLEKEWRQAIKDRDALMAQWNMYIASKREAYMKSKLAPITQTEPALEQTTEQTTESEVQS